MPIDSKSFLTALQNSGIQQYFGVPDSLLKDFLLVLNSEVQGKEHISAANEGNALAMAAGFHLSTGGIAGVYLQNSGLGNIINPLLSLCAPEVYSIPAILLIGWRGETGKPDAPQHLVQGRVQPELLDSIGIESVVLSENPEEMRSQVTWAVQQSSESQSPVAIVVRKGTFTKENSSPDSDENLTLGREEALSQILKTCPPRAIFVSTTGKISRELYEITDSLIGDHSGNFYTVGSMGHCSSIALGVAIGKPSKMTICIDGDGSMLMHMGAVPSVAKYAPSNFKHIIINNYAHESVGGQPTNIDSVNIPQLAKASGYTNTFLAQNSDELEECLPTFWSSDGCSLLEVKVKVGSRPDLKRPELSPVEYKQLFMSKMRDSCDG